MWQLEAHGSIGDVPPLSHLQQGVLEVLEPIHSVGICGVFELRVLPRVRCRFTTSNVTACILARIPLSNMESHW